ncbi:MAG: LysR substrate-binding domain-containing protein [Burkholderiales bacterium]
MTLQQLRALCEIVDRGLHLSTAASALHRSQPALSRQLQALERDLGIELFARKRNRIVELTPAGAQIVAIARRMLADADLVGRVAGETSDPTRGSLTVATTHTQARYTLPKVIGTFMKRYPEVRLTLRQATPQGCAVMVALGQADLAICTETVGEPSEVVAVPCYFLQRSVATPLRHPLTRTRPLTLEALARFPVITYEEGFNGRRVVDETFAHAGLKPRVILSAVDADVSKAYVEMGLGIAILASVAIDPKRDTGLRRLDASHLFRPSCLSVMIRRGTYLRRYMTHFIELFAPHVGAADIERALGGGRAERGRRNLPTL